VQFVIRRETETGRLLPGILGFFPALILFALLGPGVLQEAQARGELACIEEALVLVKTLPEEPVQEVIRGETISVEAEDILPEMTFAEAGMDLVLLEGEAAVERENSQPDLIIASWQNLFYRDRVEEFFATLTGNKNIAGLILSHSSLFNVPPSLAFALCWEESRFNPQAVNRKNLNKTVDRGLFQLNNASFPKLKETDFFNPTLNAYYGIAHLRWCLDTAGTDVAALAMYNAGSVRVRSDGAPKQTLDYIARILRNQQRIEETFKTLNETLTPPVEEPEEPQDIRIFVLALL